MDTIRRLIAILLITAIPAALFFWLLIHPLARFWRRAGMATAYAATGTVTVAVMAAMFLMRQRLLAVDWGTNTAGAGAGVVLLALSGWMLLTVRRQLSVRTLVGVPELAPGGESPLLDSGIYARVRHPRYLQMTIALAGYALIANYPAVYAAFLLWCGGIHAVVLLEERELAARLGPAYTAYCRRVPRYLPRRP